MAPPWLRGRHSLRLQLARKTPSRSPVPLRVALAVPLYDGNVSLGVITLYGSEDFQKDHRRMLESASSLLLATGLMGPQAAGKQKPDAARPGGGRSVH